MSSCRYRCPSRHRSWSTIFIWIGANAITFYLLNNLMISRWSRPGWPAAMWERFLTQNGGGNRCTTQFHTPGLGTGALG
jgi:hypothetical protein